MTTTIQPEPTNEQRRIIYQARRGLKELDFYIDPYVKELYLTAEPSEQETFARDVDPRRSVTRLFYQSKPSVRGQHMGVSE